MEKQTFHLWCAYPNDLLATDTARACEALLSRDEYERMENFRFDPHRREYLTARALVRTALSFYHPLAPEAWRFSKNEYGKPFAIPDCGLQFNLSHSPGLVVCLIGHGAEVGVDAEPCERAETIVEVAPTVFSPPELLQLETLRGSEKGERALLLWTLKEAYIKARGMGLSLPLNQFSLLFGGSQEIRLELDACLGDEPARWRFCELAHAGHRIAVMVQQAGNPSLQVWEWRAVLSTPTRLAGKERQWFPARAESP